MDVDKSVSKQPGLVHIPIPSPQVCIQLGQRSVLLLEEQIASANARVWWGPGMAAQGLLCVGGWVVARVPWALTLTLLPSIVTPASSLAQQQHRIVCNKGL